MAEEVPPPAAGGGEGVLALEATAEGVLAPEAPAEGVLAPETPTEGVLALEAPAEALAAGSDMVVVGLGRPCHDSLLNEKRRKVKEVDQDIGHIHTQTLLKGSYAGLVD